KLQNNIKVINHIQNKGIAGARNTLLENATGELIYFLDSDDYIEIDTIEKLVFELEKQQVDIVFDSYKLVGKEINLVRHHKILSKEEHLKQVIFRQAYFNLWGNLYKRELFHNLSFVEGHNFGEDFSIVPKLIDRAKKISFTNYAFYHYRLLNDNSYTKNINQKSLEDIMVAYASLKNYFDDKSPEWSNIINDSFYQLKAQLIKTTKGDLKLLKYFKTLTNKYPKKYPNNILLKNNLVNFLFDNLI
ncbi:MAG TPA: hypothetical protein DEG63_05765, partial [Flavobacteriaceae bacterium]|nr:hypothetical protein [Flavobacteriaceae bacterium]